MMKSALNGPPLKHYITKILTLWDYGKLVSRTFNNKLLIHLPVLFTFYMLEFVQLRCNSDLQKKGTEKCAASEVSRD